METAHRKFAATMKMPMKANDSTDMQQYDRKCRQYAANIVRAEYEKLHKKKYKVEVATKVFAIFCITSLLF